MINFFSIAPNDYSIKYLGELFGSMTSSGLLPGKEITVVGTMFSVFNSTVLAVGALIIVYMTVVGVMATAHEGEFMGKKWNNIWIPLRMLLGIATLVPTAAGYSAIQIVMMWIIIQGIGAADSLWGTAVASKSVLGDMGAQKSISAPDMGSLFQGILCDASARASFPNPNPKIDNPIQGGYFCAKGGSICSQPLTFDPNAKKLSFGPNGQCGALNYCDPSPAGACKTANSAACIACQAQIQALQAIIPTLAEIATQFVNVDYAYRDFYYNSYAAAGQNPNWRVAYDYCAAQTPPINENDCKVNQTTSNNFVNPNNGTDATAYQSAGAEVVDNVYWPYGLESTLGVDPSEVKLSTDPNDPTTCDVTSFIDSAGCEYTQILTKAVVAYSVILGTTGRSSTTDKGWIFAGAYYYDMASKDKSRLDDFTPDFKVDNMDPQSEIATYRNNYQAGTFLINAATKTGTASGEVNPEAPPKIKASKISIFPKKIRFLTDPFQKMMNKFADAFTLVLTGDDPLSHAVLGNYDPIRKLQMLGWGLIAGVYIVWGTLLAITIGAGLAGYTGPFVLGTGTDNPVGPTWLMVLFLVVPPAFALCGIMLSLGGLLTVYVPLIPYVIFTMGAIGWFLAVIEAMVAGPLVALGILSPSGQHEMLGKAEPALYLIFNIFLRPSLMVFGLLIAIILVRVVVTMINKMFGYVMVSIIQPPIYEPITLLFFISAYVMLIIAAINKCFELIHTLPHQVMHWIGGGQHHIPGAETGKEAMGEIKGGVSRTAGVAGSAVQGTKGEAIARRSAAGKKRGKGSEELSGR